jgi:hypothetical protein
LLLHLPLTGLLKSSLLCSFQSLGLDLLLPLAHQLLLLAALLHHALTLERLLPAPLLHHLPLTLLLHPLLLQTLLLQTLLLHLPLEIVILPISELNGLNMTDRFRAQTISTKL